MHLTLIRGDGHRPPAASNASGVQAALVSNVRRRPRDIGQHPVHLPLYDVEAEPADELVLVPLTPLEWSLVVSALAERGQGNSLRVGSQAHADLAVQVREAVRARTLHPATTSPTADTLQVSAGPDECDPNGIRRLW